jgi:flavin-dependent dehydrogenase
VAIARTPAGWTLDTETNRLTASWLIGADGANSLVRRRVRRAFTRKDLSVAAGYYVRGQRAGAVDIEFTGLPPGYLWSFPRPDHLAVGICGQADGTSSTELFDAARRWVASHVGAADSALSRYSWPIPSLSEESIAHEEPSGDRWLLAGDAAGLVDPITREGIFFALQSAEFASQSILGRNPSATYARLVRAHIHPELRRAARMKARFFAPAFSVLLMSALARSAGIRAVMADLVSGRQTYRGLRRRLMMTGELRLALAYLRL